MSYISTVLADNPQAFYALQETSGSTLTDSSGNDYNTTSLAGGYILGTIGPVKGYTGITFNGSTGYAVLDSRVTLASPATQISAELWVSLSNLTYTDNPRILASDHTDSDHLGIQLWLSGTGNFNGAVGYTTGYAGAGSAYNFIANTWYHIVFTYDGNQPHYYLNGTIQNTGGSTGTVTLAAGADSINIARNPKYNGDYTPATIAFVALYTTALTATQVANHYNAMIQMWNVADTEIITDSVTAILVPVLAETLVEYDTIAMTLQTFLYDINTTADNVIILAIYAITLATLTGIDTAITLIGPTSLATLTGA